MILQVNRLASALVVVALVEFLLLRLLIRLGPMLPARAEVAGLAQGAVFAGTAALNLAVILAIAGLFLVAALTPHRLLAGWVALTALAALALKLAPGADVLFIVYSGLALAAMVMVLVVAAARSVTGPDLTGLKDLSGLSFLLAGCFLAATVLGAYPVVAASAARLDWALPVAPFAPFAGEALAVVVALLTWAAYRPRWSRSAVVVATVLTALFLALALVRPWLVSTLAMWTVTFSLFLPFPVYALALGLFVYGVAALAQGDLDQRRQAYGLVLIALAGLKWDYSYLSLLSILGFMLLTFDKLQPRSVQLLLQGAQTTVFPAQVGDVGLPVSRFTQPPVQIAHPPQVAGGDLIASPAAGGDGSLRQPPIDLQGGAGLVGFRSLRQAFPLLSADHAARSVGDL